MSDQDFDRLAQAIDTFATLQRAMLRRMLPIQAFVAVLQIVSLVASVYFMRTLHNIESQQTTVREQTEELVERPVIRVEAESESSAHLVVEDPRASASVQLQIAPPSPKK